MVKYKQVAQEITDFITKNQMSQHDKLPVIDELTKQFKVSKSTIIKALDILEAKGQIYQVQGSGSFVREVILPGYINLNRPSGLTQTLQGTPLNTKVIEVKLVKPDAEIQEYLDCKDDEELYLVKRVRYIDDQPLSYEESYYRKKYVVYLNEEIAEGSIFSYLKDHLDIKPGFVNSYFKIDHLTTEEAGYLEEDVGEHCIRLVNQFFLPSGAPFDYSVLCYHKDHAQFFVPSNYY